jgi:hypothetical protein
MSYERFTPDARYYSSQQQNPIEREARFIAQQMDSGNAELAGQRLREDLMRLQRSPEEAKQLVQLVEQFDRKGNGADLDIRVGRQNGLSVATASIVDYDYYRDRRTGRMQRQVYDRDTVAKILLDDNSGFTGVSRWNNRQGYEPSGLYRPDWQYNPEPSAIIRYQNPNGWAQQDYPQQDYEQPQNRNWRRSRQPHSHQHRNDSGPRNHNTRATVSGDVQGLDNDAAYALSRAHQLASQDGVKIQVTSGFRTYAEQSRLYAELKGKSPVARPGTSAHESGEAIDVKNYAQAKPYLVAAGFVHGDGKGRIAGDPWHFRYMG